MLFCVLFCLFYVVFACCCMFDCFFSVVDILFVVFFVCLLSDCLRVWVCLSSSLVPSRPHRGYSSVSAGNWKTYGFLSSFFTISMFRGRLQGGFSDTPYTAKKEDKKIKY